MKAVQLDRARFAAPDASGLSVTAESAAAAALAAPVSGGRVGLVILVQFPDDPATVTVDPTNFPATQVKMDRYCNEAGYTDDGNTGSIRDYFYDQSNTKLTFTQVVTAIVTLPNPRSYYNYSNYPTNSTLPDCGVAGRQMVADAIAVLKTSGFDFSALSLDTSNNVIATSLLFAGYDSGVWSFGLWPHSWALSTKINVGTTSSPRYISSYQCTNVPTAAPAIGTACHELAHMLMKYPDFYDTDITDGDSEGVGEHCLMGSGNWLNSQKTPAPIDLYLKDFSGWASITDLSPTVSLDAFLSTTGNSGYRIRKPGTTTQYFLVENRGVGDKWATYCPDKGLMIWHVDEAVTTDNMRQQMTASQHYQLSLEQADGQFDLENNRDRGDSTDLFDNGGLFANATTPNANWWDGTASGVSISVRSAAGASMSVRFLDGGAPAPEIAVEQPLGTNLTDGSASIAFGSVLVGNTSSAFTFTVKNLGSADLTGLAVRKDGTHATDFTVSSLSTTTLAVGGSTTFTVTFAPGAADTRTAALHIDSNDADENPFDITLSGTGLGALSGTKTVGPSGADYTSLTASTGLFAAINSRGVNGVLTVQIIGNLSAETGTIALNPLTGTTPSLKIFPAGGARSVSGSSSGALIRLKAADNVTLDGSLNGNGTDRSLTLTNTNTGTSSAVVWLQSNGTDGATGNTIKNLNVSGKANTQTLVGIGSGSSTISISSRGAGNNGNTIQNNSISKCQYGIYSAGTNVTTKNTGNVISQNLLNTASPNHIAKGGILVGFENNITITQNTIDGPTYSSSTDTFGISLGWTSITATAFTGSEVTNATVTRNVIGKVTHTGTYSAVGIAVAAATSGTTLIANNSIYGVGGKPTSTAKHICVGIFLGGGIGSTTQVYFNSVSMTGTFTGGSSPSYALAIGESNPIIDVRNNILFNTQATGTGISYAIGTASTTFSNLTSNHNVLFVNTGTLFGLGKTGGLYSTSGTSGTTLANWQATTGKDANSVAANPLFFSLTDLHITNSGSPAWQAGVLIAGITKDMDGETRSATPGIGADEPSATTPVVTTNPSNITVNPGANVSFTAAATGYPEPTVQWQVSTDGGANFTNIEGATTVPLSFEAVVSDNGNHDRALFTNSANSTSTTAATLTIITSYTTWQTRKFSVEDIEAGLTTPTADFDSDGLANLLEYAFGADPKTPDVADIVPTVTHNPMQIAFPCDAACTDITYTVQSSSDLTTWTDIAKSIGGATTLPIDARSTVLDSGTLRTVTVIDSTAITDGKRFLRVIVSSP